MNKNIIVQFYLLLWLFPLLGHGQIDYVSAEQEEYILLHTDRELYISGETVWFKIYAFNKSQNSRSNLSKVAYLELINPKGLSLSRVKVELIDGWGIGSMELPAILSSDQYILRGYTQSMRNFGAENFGHKKLIIINPKQALLPPSEKALKDEKPINKEITTGEKPTANQPIFVRIQTNKEQFGQRELVQLDITAKDDKGQPLAAQFSIGVALTNPNQALNPSILQKIREEKSVDLSNSIIKPVFRTESNGLSLSGKVINTQTNEALPNAEIYLAFAGKTAMVYTAISDLKGDFNFLLPKLFGVQQIVVQALSKETKALKILIDEEFHEVTKDTTTSFSLSSDWVAYANNLMVNAQITQAYQAFAPQSTYSSAHKFADLAFFGAPDKQYFLDDYTRFPLPEFFFEIVPTVRVKGKYKEEYLEVSNNWESSMSNVNPLLLVDGVPVFDPIAFLKINNRLIKSTEIITAPFWLNPGVYNGIVQLSSYEGDARSFSLPETAIRQSYLTFLPQKQFPTPNYNAPIDTHLPDFRNTLYWNPKVETNAAGKATISFFTSDALGDYTIQVEGFAEKRMLESSSKRIFVIQE